MIAFVTALLMIFAFLQNETGADSRDTGSMTFPSFYEMGKTVLDDGHWEQALQIWHQGQSALSEHNLSDPRLAFAYIELAAKKSAQTYYPIATEMYYWAFRTADWKTYRKELSDEIHRIIPLIDIDERYTWEKRVRKRDSTLFSDVLEFWITRDPLATSALNERLIQHWERIAYARENYKLASNSPYGTDDRGTIYVRFGEPDDIRIKNISLSEVTDPYLGIPIFVSTNVSVRLELWTYHMEGMHEPARFFFGNSPNGGRYRLQDGILRMIPIAGNRVYMGGSYVIDNTGNNDGIGSEPRSGNSDFIVIQNPLTDRPIVDSRGGSEFLIKFGVLEQLSYLDPYFSELYDEMYRTVISHQGNFDRAYQAANARIESFEVRRKTEQNYMEPSSTTDLLNDMLSNITLDHAVYRKLDRNTGNTIYVLSLGSDVESQAAFEIERSHSINLNPELHIVNSVESYDVSWTPVSRDRFSMELVDLYPYYSSYYLLDESDAGRHIVVNSELLNTGRMQNSGSIIAISGDRARYFVAGSGSKRIRVPERLKMEDGNILISDIFIGRSQEVSYDDELPFIPAAQPVFHREEEILLFFEIYNLHTTDESGEYPYEITYEINRITDDGKHIIQDDVYAGITLLNRSETDYDQQWFSIQLEEEKTPGHYMITFDFNHAGETRTRQVSFEIREHN